MIELIYDAIAEGQEILEGNYSIDGEIIGDFTTKIIYVDGIADIEKTEEKLKNIIQMDMQSQLGN